MLPADEVDVYAGSAGRHSRLWYWHVVNYDAEAGATGCNAVS